jgi:hypothetical protein
VDGSAISSTEVVVRPFPASRNELARIQAEVDEELPFAVSVRNEEAARCSGTDVCAGGVCCVGFFCWW